MLTTASKVTSARDWRDTLQSFLHPRVVTMLFLGFSAGVPILLIFSSLSLWLGEAGVQKSAVTFFSWAALGYSFKFVWAPLIDKLPLPLLTRLLGRRRGWLLVSQFAIMSAILWMAVTDPALGESSLTTMAMAAVLLGFSSATQDIVIDAYRIESAESDLQALMSSTYIAGYRIGMIVAGAGALYLADYFGTEREAYNHAAWMNTYAIMSAVMLVGVVTTFMIPEPEQYRANDTVYNLYDYLRFFVLFLLVVAGFIAVFYSTSNAGAESLESAGLASGLGLHNLYVWMTGAKNYLTELFSNQQLAGFLIESLRLAAALCVAWLIAKALMAFGVVRTSMVREAYLEPVRDFFQRYGRGLAVLLLFVDWFLSGF